MPAQVHGEPKNKILIFESSSQMTTSLSIILQEAFELFFAGDAVSALELAKQEDVDLAIIGGGFPLSFYERLFPALRDARPGLPFLVVVEDLPPGRAELNFPGLEWLKIPFPVEALRESIDRLMAQKKTPRPQDIFSPPALDAAKRWVYSYRISPETRERLLQVCASSLPIYICGEEGTGAGEVAKAVHFLRAVNDGPFWRVACRGLKLEMFTQRLSFWSRSGEFPLRGRPTLFLEGVDALEEDIQAALLDIWNDKQIHWPGMGGRLNVRLISSSASPLGRAVSAGRFREDLYQILTTLPLSLPPLRDRRDEIPAIITEILRENGLEKKLSSESMHLLQEYYWPGNLRELESVVLRSTELCRGEILLPNDLFFTFSREAVIAGRENQAVKRPPVPGVAISAAHEESFFDAAVSALAHEIKNPLVAISTFAHLLPEKFEDPEFREQFSPLVGLEVRRINLLLENLLEYVQLAPPRFCGNDLSSVVHEILAHDREPGINPVRFRCDFAPDLPGVLFDSNHLKYVVQKILENTSCGVPEGKEVRLRANTVVKREGGSERDFVELIFAYESQEGITRKISHSLEEPGVGERGEALKDFPLTLLLAKKVVERNGGKLQVSEEAGGSFIRVFLPFSK